jgi:structure-specific recognition protein 1
MVCEMRFFVPGGVGGRFEDAKDGSGSDEGTEETGPAQHLYRSIVKRANIGTFAGEAIVTLLELPMVTPRGKYSLDMYQTFLKFHGRTHNFKILYRNISKAFVLPKPDGQHIGFVIALQTPIKQGQTYYPFLVLQFHKETKERAKLNLAPEQLKEAFGGRLESEIEGPLHEVLSQLFAAMIKTKIVTPSGFHSSTDAAAVRCSIKASDGHLYPLDKSLLFVTKPVVHIRLADVQYVEFARVSQSNAQPNRSFDLNITAKTGEAYQFTGLDRNEYRPLLEYIQQKKITIRNVEAEPAEPRVLPEQLVSPLFYLQNNNLEEEESEDEDYKASEARTCCEACVGRRR